MVTKRATKKKPAARKRAPARKGAGTINKTTLEAILFDVSAGKPVWRAIEENRTTRDGFYKLLARDPKVQERYARAKEAGLDVVADEIIMLSDQSRIGVKTTTKADGTQETVDGDMVERTRLQIDSRKWLLAKLAPKKYGDRTAIEHTFDPAELMTTLAAARERSLKG